LQRQDPGSVFDHGPFDFHDFSTPDVVNHISSFPIMRYYYCGKQINLVIAGSKIKFWEEVEGPDE
jgi:hypothetical protein